MEDTIAAVDVKAAVSLEQLFQAAEVEAGCRAFNAKERLGGCHRGRLVDVFVQLPEELASGDAAERTRSTLWRPLRLNRIRTFLESVVLDWGSAR